MPHFRTPDGMFVDFEVEKLGRNILPGDYEREVFEAYKPAWASMSFDDAVASHDFPRIRTFITWQMWNDMKTVEEAISAGSPPPGDAMGRLKAAARRKGGSVMAHIWVRTTCRFAGAEAAK
jgi:hypothetical protein